jgi:hypothetical protein
MKTEMQNIKHCCVVVSCHHPGDPFFEFRPEDKLHLLWHIYCDIPHSPQTNIGTEPYDKPWPLPLRSLPIHYSVSPSRFLFDAILTSADDEDLLNKQTEENDSSNSDWTPLIYNEISCNVYLRNVILQSINMS